MVEIELLKLLDKTLPEKYPIVNYKHGKVKYSPSIHTLEQGEIAWYLDTKIGMVLSGTIEDVNFSHPERLPIYSIRGGEHMYHRVWPKVDAQGDIMRDQDFLSKSILLERKPEEVRELIGKLEQGLVEN